MAEDWGSVAAEVAAALADVGFTVTLTRPGAPTGPAYNPTPGTPTTHTLLVMRDSVTRDTVGAGLRDGTTVLASDVRLMAAAAGTTPLPGDRVTMGGEQLAIVNVEPFAPGGVPLFYDMILRA